MLMTYGTEISLIRAGQLMSGEVTFRDPDYKELHIDLIGLVIRWRTYRYARDLSALLGQVVPEGPADNQGRGGGGDSMKHLDELEAHYESYRVDPGSAR